MRLFRVLPGPRYLVPFFFNLMSTSPGSHKHDLEKRVPGKIFRQAHTLPQVEPLYQFCLFRDTNNSQNKDGGRTIFVASLS